MNAALRRYFHYSVSHFGNAEAVGSLQPIVAGLALVTSLLLLGPCAFGQNLSSGTIRGSVLDPSGAAVKGAAVEIQNPVTGYSRTVQADDQGNFEFPNVPFNPYHLSVTAAGFEASQQDVDVRTAVPIELKISLKIGTATTSVTVQAEANDMIETTPTAHTDVGEALIKALPVQNQSTG
ncbi:MAG: hypothetical protein DMG27_08295, partial [Acidobacteria bacterium]